MFEMFDWYYREGRKLRATDNRAGHRHHYRNECEGNEIRKQNRKVNNRKKNKSARKARRKNR
jgi:hypothetical protein